MIGNTVPVDLAQKFADEKNSQLTISGEDLGDFYLENKLLVKKGAEILFPEFDYIDSVDYAFEQNMACRFEKVPSENLEKIECDFKSVILDVGHNPQSLEKFIEKYNKEENSDDDKICVVFGCKNSKDYRLANKMLGEFADMVYFVEPYEGIA